LSEVLIAVVKMFV